jgi:hypothetical protein
MLALADFYGGGQAISRSTGFSFQSPPIAELTLGFPRVLVITLTSSGQTVTLPNLLDPRLSVGIHNLIIINGGSTNAFNLAGSGFTTFSLGTKKGVIISVYNNSGSKEWTGYQSQWDWRP